MIEWRYYPSSSLCPELLRAVIHVFEVAGAIAGSVKAGGARLPFTRMAITIARTVQRAARLSDPGRRGRSGRRGAPESWQAPTMG